MQLRLRRLGLLFLVGGAFIVAACAHHGSPAPAPQAKVISRGDPSRMVVALTFDAGYLGPDSVATGAYTTQVLDTLKARGIKASIAMTGVFATGYPDLLLRMVSDGHVLMNHTYHHWHFVHTVVFPGQKPGLTQAQRWDELDTTDALVQKVTGVSTQPYFRAPYGDDDASVNADVYARGYTYNVRWSVDSLGWQSLPPDKIILNVLAQTRPGAIILFHLGIVQDATALPPIVDGLRNLGYGFVTVPEMIAAGGTGP